MNDAIYLIEPSTKLPTRVDRVNFADIGVKERQDLEAWVLAHPQILGERLLVISSEFHRFDKSNRRLDVLALDEDGNLVVVELKLDIVGSHADLQAIRYAAFCSTMTMADVIEELAATKKGSKEAAENTIREFLAVDELPELGDRPRILLVAGAMDDQEITSCVLWLRRFGLDIGCVELTPYRVPSGMIVLVPKTIIPLPETREYMVKVEKKEVAKVEKSKSLAEDSLWALAVRAAFNALKSPLSVGMTGQQWILTRGGSDNAHYGWWRMKRENSIRVGIGFRSKDAAENDAIMNVFRRCQTELSASLGTTLHFQDDWGPLTRRMFVTVPYDGTQPIEEVAQLAAEQMAKLVSLTLPELAARGLHAS